MSTEARDIESDFLKRVKQAVLEVEPSAEVYLYGSRARGEADAESDWDFLILLEGPVDQEREERLRYSLYEMGRAGGEVFNLMIYRREDWHDKDAPRTPYQANVRREDILL